MCIEKPSMLHQRQYHQVAKKNDQPFRLNTWVSMYVHSNVTALLFHNLMLKIYSHTVEIMLSDGTTIGTGALLSVGMKIYIINL